MKQLGIFLLFLNSCAYSSIDSSSYEKGSKPISFKDTFRTHSVPDRFLYSANISSNSQQIALNDSDNRVNQEFDVPESMRGLVGFWLKIYTEFSARQMVLFDKEHPELIYEVFDFNELSATSRNEVVYEILREKKAEKRIKEYKAAFQRLIARKKPLHLQKLTHPVEKRIADVLMTCKHKHSLFEMSKNLRAQTGQRDQVYRGLMNASYFFPKMEEIFKQLDVPIELTRLTLVESSFNLKAFSKSGARGVWQFMLAPGKEYMHVQNDGLIDERLSPIKSTVAAARLLLRNLKIASNWPLAITAYHHGYTAIRKLNPKQRQTALDGSLFDLCNKKTSLGYASSNYYAEFLAILHTEAYKDLFFGKEAPMPSSVPNVRFERLKAPVQAYKYIVSSNMNVEDFKKFNPDVTNLNVILPKGFYLARPTQNSFAPDDLITNIRAKLKGSTPLRAEQPTNNLRRKGKNVS